MPFMGNSTKFLIGNLRKMRSYYRYLLILLFLVSGQFVFGKTVTVTSEYVYQIPENMSPDKAREVALTRARQQAIADEFGTTVTQTTSVRVTNNNGESDSDFLSFGGSELKGEWLEDTEAPVFEYITNGSALAIKVKIKGKIRELQGSKVPVAVKLLRNNAEDLAESESFESDDDLFVSFQSPVNGYLAIYLLDNDNNAFCLLPYRKQTDGAFETKGNKKYILFHSDFADGVKPEIVDRFVVYTDLEREYNRIMIIFSPNKFYKSVDSQTSSELPRSLTQGDFQKWLSSVRKQDVDLNITERNILITRKN